MAIPAATMAAINNEGIVNVEDLEGFEKDDIDTMSKNFRSPPAGQPVVVFGVKSQKRLLVAAHMVRYYQATK